MASKLSLISFCIEVFQNKTHKPDFDQYSEAPEPIVQAAHEAIKNILSSILVTNFHDHHNVIERNEHNYITVSAKQGPNNTLLIATIRFVRILSQFVVSIDVEEQSLQPPTPQPSYDWEGVITNKNMKKVADQLNSKFELKNQIEQIPIIKRGRFNMPNYLVSSDDRVLEYDFDKILYHEKNCYQDIKIVDSPSLGKTLLLDDLQNLAEADFSYTAALVELESFDYRSKEILILGGGDCAVLDALYQKHAKLIVMAEIDKMVVDASRHLKPQGPRLDTLDTDKYDIIYDDCMSVMLKYLKEGKRFDVIVSDLTDIPLMDGKSTKKENEADFNYLTEILATAVKLLRDSSSVIQTHATGKGNIKSLCVWEDFMRDQRLNFARRESYVPSYMETWVFYRIWPMEFGRQ